MNSFRALNFAKTSLARIAAPRRLNLVFNSQWKRQFRQQPYLRNSEEDMAKLKALYEQEASKPDRMIIGFTCKVCDERSYKSMSKKSYEKGVVIIKCDSCRNLHLIADHLGWFDSMNKVGTIEDILRARGESVQKLEYLPDE